MIPVGWLAPNDCWDQHIVRQLLDGNLYPHGIEFRHVSGYPNTTGPAVLIVPGRFWWEHAQEIAGVIRRYSSVLAFRVSDEEDLFDPLKVEHPNTRWWVQTPREGREYPEGTRFIGVGYPPHMSGLPSVQPFYKDLDVFLSAQRTHKRREEAFEALEHSTHTKLVEPTAGFTQGMSPTEYRAAMLRARVAPCPSGAVSPDCFRLWEAIEAGAVPIVDTVSPVDGETRYWERLFADSWPVPFPVYTDASELPALITQTLADWPAVSNRVQAWWARYRRELSTWLRSDLGALGAL